MRTVKIQAYIPEAVNHTTAPNAHSTVRLHSGEGGVVRFIGPSTGFGSVWHIEDPASARKLRDILKPLADRA